MNKQYKIIFLNCKNKTKFLKKTISKFTNSNNFLLNKLKNLPKTALLKKKKLQPTKCPLLIQIVFFSLTLLRVL